MANQVVGTGSVEIIFDYEKNLKKSINDIKKAWSNSNIGDVFKQIDSSMVGLNKNTEKAVISIKKVSKSQDDNQKLIEKAIERTALFADKKYYQMQKSAEKSAKSSAQAFIDAEKIYEAEFKKLLKEEENLKKKANKQYEADFKKLQVEESKIDNLKLQQKIKISNQIRSEEERLKNSQIKSARESFNVFVENENKKLALLKQNDIKRLTSSYGNSKSTFNYIPSDYNKGLLNAQKTQQSQTGYGSKSISNELKNTSTAYKEADVIIKNRIKQNEILKNQELMLSKAFQTSKGVQKEYITTLQQQVKAGEPLSAQQKERIRLLREEDKNQRSGAFGYGLASYGLQQLGSSMLNVAKSAVVYQAQIEKSLAVTSAVAGSGTEGIQQLEEAMIRMGTDIPVRFQLISKSMYEMASAGLDVQEILEAMPQALKLAQGVGENLSQTTNLLISTVKSFDMDFSDSKRILDVFANSVAKSMATVEKLQVSFTRVAPVAQNVGVSFEETTAILSKLYDLGLKGSNAGTVLGNVMTRLTTFTNQSTKALEKAGLSTEDVSLEYNTLGESLAKITIAMRENKLGAEQLQYIFGTRGKIITDFLNQLDGENVDELTTSYNDLVKSITDASGATDKFYKVQEETTQMTLDRAQNAIDRLKLASGEALKETVQPLVGSFADMANSIADGAENSEAMNDVLKITLTTLGGAGGLIELAGKLAMPLLALSSLKNLLTGGAIAAGAAGLTTVFMGVGESLYAIAIGSEVAGAGLVALLPPMASFLLGFGAILAVAYAGYKTGDLLVDLFSNIRKSNISNEMTKINDSMNNLAKTPNFSKFEKEWKGWLDNRKFTYETALKYAKDDTEKTNIELQYKKDIIQKYNDWESGENSSKLKDESKYYDDSYNMTNNYVVNMKSKYETEISNMQTHNTNYKTELENKRRITEDFNTKQVLSVEEATNEVIKLMNSQLQSISKTTQQKQLKQMYPFLSGDVSQNISGMNETMLSELSKALYGKNYNEMQVWGVKDFIKTATAPQKQQAMKLIEDIRNDRSAYEKLVPVESKYKGQSTGLGGGNLSPSPSTNTSTNTSTPQSELDLAQKYVSEYFDEINSTIESTLSANVRKLQSDRDMALKGLDKGSAEYNRIYSEYSKKEEQLNIQSGLEREKKQKESLENLNDVNSKIYNKYINNAIKENENLDKSKFESGISGETFKLYSKENKFEPTNVTDIAKFTETAIENVKDSFTSFNTYAKNINELSEIFEKSDDINIRESAKSDIAKNIQKINDLDTVYKLEEIKIDQEYDARLKSARTKEERDLAIIDWERKLSELNKTQKINIYKFMEDLDKNGSALAMSNIGEGLLELYKINEKNAKAGIENIKEKTNKMLKQLETDIGAEEFNKILPDVAAIMSKFDLDGDFESYYKTLNSLLSNTLSAKNERLNLNLEKATKNMNDVFDNFINAVNDTGVLVENYEKKSKGMNDEQKTQFKSAIKDSINKITGNEGITDYLMSLLDSNIEAFKSGLDIASTESLAGMKNTEGYKKSLGEFKKSKKAIKGNENLTDAQLESEFSDKMIEVIKNVIKEMENETTAREKFVDKMEKTINSLSSLSSALDQLASTTGSSTLGGVASALSGGLAIATGVQTATANVGVDAIAGIAGGLSAVSAGISMVSSLADSADAKVEADNEKNIQMWENSISAIDEITSTLQDNFTSLISYTMDLVENTTPTTSNVSKGQSQIQYLADTLASQDRNFSDVIYASSHSGNRGLKSSKSIQRTSGMDLQTLYSALGFSGDVDTTATLEDLQDFTDKLNSLSLNEFDSMFMLDNEGLERFYLHQANFEQLASEIQAYIDLMEKAQKQAEQFVKLSTFADFTGFEVSDIDELYQSYIDQYTEMGVTITDSIKDYLYALAEDNAITETVTADVRDGFVSGWSQGQDAIESLSSSLETYFSGIMENLSKVYYDTVLDTFNSTLSEFYVNYMEALADIKTSSGDITNFATSYDYSSILKAISDAQDLENTLSEVYTAIREQAENAGISGVLIDEMLGDEYRLTIRDNISSAVSSGIMDGFNDGDITEADIKNSIFSTIVEQAMTDIIDDIMSENGVTSIVTQIANALQSGDTTSLESLGISLTDSINAGLDESSATIEYLMGLLDKYSGENTDPIVFFDESNLESIQQSMKDYQDFSIKTIGLSSSVETTKRIEITISASGSLTDAELKAIAQQVSEEVRLEVSTSKYI